MSTAPAVLRGLGRVLSTSLRADPRGLVAGTALKLLAAPATPLYAWQLTRMVEAAIAGRTTALVLDAVGLAAIWVIATASNSIGTTMLHGVKERTELLIDVQLITLTARLSGLEHLERPDDLDRMGLLRDERLAINQATVALVNTVTVAVQLTVTAALLGSIHPILVLLPLFAVPSVWAGIRGQGVLDRAEESTAPDRRLADRLLELAVLPSAGAEIRMFGLAAEVSKRHRGRWAHLSTVRSRARWIAALYGVGGGLFFAAGYAACVGFVVSEAIMGRAGVGDVLLAVAATGLVQRQVGAGVQEITSLVESNATVQRLLWLDDLAERSSTAPANPARVPDRVEHGIDLQQVSFRYPGTDTEVLRGVDLHIPAGSSLAIVGENGAGKSTLVKLLCRFYDPTAGSIRIDGADLRQFGTAAWHARLSAAFQDFVRFEFALRETVGVGDLDLLDNDEALLTAIEWSAAGDLLEALPEGLSTVLGTTYGPGHELSGGQWQKTAMARAMLRPRPLLLLLDEPAANLDPLAEHIICERYLYAANRIGRATGAITVLVSHRFSTVRAADVIVVVDRGGIAEVGNHDELMARAGLYAELYALQARGYR